MHFTFMYNLIHNTKLTPVPSLIYAFPKHHIELNLQNNNCRKMIKQVYLQIKAGLTTSQFKFVEVVTEA